MSALQRYGSVPANPQPQVVNQREIGGASPPQSPPSTPMLNQPQQPDRFSQFSSFDLLGTPTLSLNDFGTPSTATTQVRPLKDRFVVGLGCLISSAVAVSLIALICLRDYGQTVNAFLSSSAGFFTFLPVVCLLPQSIGDGVKDTLIKFSHFIYFDITNAFLSLPAANNPSDGNLALRVTNAILMFAMGNLIAAQVHNIYHWRLADDLVAQPDATIELVSPMAAQNVQIQNDHRIPVLTSKEYTFGLIDVKKPSHDRCIQAIALGVIFGAGFLIAGYTTSSILSLVGIKMGFIFLGLASGNLTHEGIRAVTKALERHQAESEVAALGLRFFRLIGKVEMIAATLFVAAIGLDSHYATILGAFCYGLKGQIKWIRFTRTPVVNQPELQTCARSKMRFKAHAIGITILSIIWFGYYLWRVIVGDTVEKIAISVFSITYYALLGIGYLVDRHDILNSENKLLNTLFYHLRYSIAPPMFFFGITQVMEIGSEALSEYVGALVALASIAWISLGIPFGAYTASILTSRDSKYPADLSCLFPLFVYYFSQIIFGVASTSGES